MKSCSVLRSMGRTRGFSCWLFGHIHHLEQGRLATGLSVGGLDLRMEGVRLREPQGKGYHDVIGRPQARATICAPFDMKMARVKWDLEFLCFGQHGADHIAVSQDLYLIDHFLHCSC